MKVTGNRNMSPCFLYIGWLFLLFSIGTSAQQNDSLKNAHADSIERNFLKIIKKAGADEAAVNIAKYKADKIALHQHKIADELKTVIQQVNAYLKNGLDTTQISNRLTRVEGTFKIVKDGIFVNKGSAQTQRNLTSSSTILTRLIEEMGNQKAEIDTYTKDLARYRLKVDSLSSDSTVFVFPSDSSAAVKYFTRLMVIAREVRPVDSAMNDALVSIQSLQNKTDVLVFELRTSLEEIELFRKKLSGVESDRDFANIWDTVAFYRPFSEIIHFSAAKEKLALVYYIFDNAGTVVILILLTGACALFIRTLKRRLIQDMFGKMASGERRLVTRYPVLSAILIVVSLFQFAFVEPPFIFKFILWLISAVCLTLIFKKYIVRHWLISWMVIVTLFILAGMDNFILQASRAERWIMLSISLAGVFYGGYISVSGQRRELKEKNIVPFIKFFIIVEFLAASLNVFGRYNLAKAVMVSGYVGVLVAILFLWTARLINEGLAFASTVYKQPGRNIDRAGNKASIILYILLITGWIVLVGQNFYSFKQIAEPLSEFLAQDRTIGDYKFTIRGILIFIAIAFCSLLLSRIVSFFASDVNIRQSKPGANKIAGLGSWILLVRIVIITAGLLLAFVASGIPIDRITIVLGALSVGIGLGLQGLVNNLVSGLIIAFERPVNVGDLIEVSGKAGTMKSIGFRSSIVTLSDGACLIIPNGDLLSQHLVNWTMGDNKKRLSMLIGVEFGSDLEKVKQILADILKSDERIAKYPEPLVAAKDVSQGKIDFQYIFWVNDMNVSFSVTGDIIAKIEQAFKEAGIIISSPRHDLFLRPADLPADLKKKPD